MSTSGTPMLRLACFGEIEGGAWGVAWGDLLLTEKGSLPVVIEGGDPGEPWRLSGEGVQLAVAPEGEAVIAPSLAGFDQLCRVTGTLHSSPMDCPGRRATRAGEPLEAVDSIRDFSAWLAPADGVALTALRLSGAAGHGDDRIAAALFEPAGATPVADPRLSTTYDGAGIPTRVGLELWLQQPEEETEPFPRRVAAASLGPAVSANGGAGRLLARPLRCYAHGLQGLAVYVLARPAG